MKKLLVLILLGFSFNCLVAQGCLPEGIVFTNQGQINNFQTNYPGCTTIVGDVRIQGSDITNLIGLNVLTSIGGMLVINFNDLLTSFSGLDNLTSIGGEVTIAYNPISDLTGLESLTYVGGSMGILYNVNLINLTGIEDLTTVGGVLTIEYNDLLNNIMSLDNIEGASLVDLIIVGNISLANCEAQSICDYLADPAATTTVYNNATGCNSREEIETACNSSSFCLPDGIIFITQAQVDSFQYNYPGCTKVGGDLKISLSNISDLSGLGVLTSIGRDLVITDNLNLTSLNGLENIESIGRDFFVSNTSLNSFSGFSKLNHIGRDIVIGDNVGGGNPLLVSLTGLELISAISGKLAIEGNQSLKSFVGLENLNWIGGSLSISSNDSLENIEGIANIIPYTILNLYIDNNKLLSTCAVHSVCSYLSAPNGTVLISNNAVGCNTEEQVEAACVFLETNGNPIKKTNTVFPNPSDDFFTICFTLEKETHLRLTVLNSLGQVVKTILNEQLGPGLYHEKWDASGLPGGVYYSILRVGEKLEIMKMIKFE